MRTRKVTSRLMSMIIIALVVSQVGVVLAEPHKVLPGESLWLIGRRHGSSVQAIVQRNGLVGTTIYPGQVLDVPTPNDRAPNTGARARLNVTKDEFELLARMIAAEAQDQPYAGKVAVGSVIINRVVSSQFPNTIAGVLFEPGQFEPIQNGWFWKARVTQTERSAALDALQGWDPTNGALYFFAYMQVRSSWLWSRPWKTTIGDHRFTA